MDLGIAQLQCTPLDVPANLAAASAAVRSAVADGAQLVVLPELASTGYVLDPAGLRACAESVWRPGPGPALASWAGLAGELGVTIVGGFAELAGGRLYNSVAVLDPSGLIGHYRKLHLFGRERDVFQPGDLGLPIVPAAGVRLGVLVCYDLRFPEVARILALRGAELIAVPTAWVAGFDAATPATGRIGQVDGALVQANLNAVFLACADQAGPGVLGRSVVADPFGRPLLGPLSPSAAEVAVCPLDLDLVRQARHRGPGISPLADRRTDVYAELLGYPEAKR